MLRAQTCHFYFLLPFHCGHGQFKGSSLLADDRVQSTKRDIQHLVGVRWEFRAPNAEAFITQMVLFDQSRQITIGERSAVSRNRAAVISVKYTIAFVLAFFIRTASDSSPGMVFLVVAPENGLWIRVTRSHCSALVETTRRLRINI